MEGLEITETKKEAFPDDHRFDAQYFQKRYLLEEGQKSAFPVVTLSSVAFITDGPHGYHELDPASPIAMLTASDAFGWFAARTSSDLISVQTHEANCRSALCERDVILSTRGTLGYAALVRDDSLPANIDQDLARINILDGSPVQAEYVVAYLQSHYGQNWIERNATGMVQQGISLNKLRNLQIPILSREMQQRIAWLLNLAYDRRSDAIRSLERSSELLLSQLGLQGWTAPKALTYKRTLRQLKEAGRFDAEYFDPHVQSTIAELSRQSKSIGDVGELRCEVFSPQAGVPFQYIEIGDLLQDGTVAGTRLDGSEAPSRAKWRVRGGDVITSTVRPIRRLSALIQPEQDGAIASSGFAVLKPKDVAPEVLLTYLRLPVICNLMNLHTTASMYPAIAVDDILSLPFLRPSAAVEQEIVNAVVWARQARQRATELLERARQAVDLAIEKSEEAALTFLKE